MAKYETKLRGNFDELLKAIHDGILGGSVSAKLEDGADYRIGDIRCAVRVYERYSVVGGNRLGMNITILGEDENLTLCAITAGGSSAVFFKINRIGENSFLEKLIPIVEEYKTKKRY